MTTGLLMFLFGVVLLLLTAVLALHFYYHKPKYQPENPVYIDKETELLIDRLTELLQGTALLDELRTEYLDTESKTVSLQKLTELLQGTTLLDELGTEYLDTESKTVSLKKLSELLQQEKQDTSSSDGTVLLNSTGAETSVEQPKVKVQTNDRVYHW